MSAAAALLASLAAASPAAAAPVFPSPQQADIQPGVQTYTEGAQCTSNFVFYGDGKVYIGQAAHCASTDGSTATNGCKARSRPLGTSVRIRGQSGATYRGTLAYSSWLAMRRANEQRFNVCEFNDFALVKVAQAAEDEVNPTIPFWGGPTGLVDSTRLNQRVYSYGNSSLRLGLLKAKRGRSLGQCCGGWNHDVYTFTPGIPGDSGSAFIQSAGKAFGVLATVAVAPFPASNGITDLSRAMSYMRDHGGPGARLARGTQPFSP